MDYQVWTHDEYEGWAKVDCGDLEAAQREIFKALKTGKEPLLTVIVPYDVTIKVKEDKIGEAPKGKTEPGEGPGPKSKSKVRPGDPEPVSELDKGSGDPSAGDSVPGK